MIRRTHATALTLSILLAAFLGGCQQSANEALPTAPAPTPNNPVVAHPTVSATLPAVFSPTPAVLPKPACLGPVGPAIISMPAFIREPSIRVRISGILPRPPSIPRGAYRGRVVIDRLSDGKFVAINILPIESYLAGVLSKELYPGWSPRAYRAQAIAARTYAVYQIAATPRGSPWNVTGTEASQMYGGKRGESAKAWHAVVATRGLVMYARAYGRTGVFCAYYSACNGGASQSPADAWGDLPMACLPARLTGMTDSACPKFTWPPMRISKWTITTAVRRWGLRNHLPYLADLGLVRSVAITKWNAITGRPTQIAITDVHGHQGVMRAEEFRLALLTDRQPGVPKPPSSFFAVQDAGTAIVLVHGRGFGHGIGLSQWGAQALALRGDSAWRILQYYYPGTVLHRQW